MQFYANFMHFNESFKYLIEKNIWMTTADGVE